MIEAIKVMRVVLTAWESSFACHLSSFMVMWSLMALKDLFLFFGRPMCLVLVDNFFYIQGVENR